MNHIQNQGIAQFIRRNLHCFPGCIGLFLSATLVFSFFPNLDPWVTEFFYAGDGQFPANDVWLVQVLYHGTPWAGRVVFVCSVLLLILAVLWPSKVPRRNWRQAAAVVTVVLLGIGLVVHAVLKDGMGRPRPRDVQVFAGPTAFVPAFVPSQFCKTNCSFVSGHAAVGFALMSFGIFGVRRKRQFWFLTSLVAGGVIGLARIAQGGHFLSDIVFSLIAIWLSHLFIRSIWLRFRVWQLHKRLASRYPLRQSL
jgi:lipid A 4'-phosphatase